MQLKTCVLLLFVALAAAASQQSIAAPSPDQSLSASLGRLAAQLYAVSRGPSGGAAVDEWAKKHGWRKAPIAGQGLLRNSTQYVGEWGGHVVLVGHDDTRGAVFVSYAKSLVVDDVLDELRHHYTLKAFNSSDTPDARGVPDFRSRTFFAEEDGRETTFIEIQSTLPGGSTNFTMIGIVPSELVRAELRAGPPVRK